MLNSFKENFSHCGNNTYKIYSILKRKNEIIQNKQKKLGKDMSDQKYFDKLKIRIDKLKNKNYKISNDKLKIKKYISKNMKKSKKKIVLSHKSILKDEINNIPPLGSYNIKFNQVSKKIPNAIISNSNIKRKNPKIIKNDMILPGIKNSISINNFVDFKKMFGRSKFDRDYILFLKKNRISNDSKLHDIDYNKFKEIKYKSIKTTHFKKIETSKSNINKIRINPLYEPNYDFNKKKIIKDIIF